MLMSLSLVPLTLLCSTYVLATSVDQCPTYCMCYLDGRGRNTVLCRNGGLTGPLALNMSDDTEVLKITAPEDNLNELQMSPIFMSNYRRLEEIHIIRSNIPQLGQHFFIYLERLDVLNLSQNNITQPLDHNFRGLLRLQELYLDDNRISSLPSGTFRYLPELRLLSIQRNRITELTPHMFLENRKLKVLRLSGNQLHALNPIAFQDIQDLKALECRSCGLDHIDTNMYELLPELTHLDLGDNFISVVRASNLSKMHNLQTLRLDGNRLSVLKNEPFGNLQQLRILDLHRNSIHKLVKTTFENLNNLTDLDLSWNNLNHIVDGLFEPFVNGALEKISLSGNHLDSHSLETSFLNLSVRELRLADCGISTIQKLIFPETVLVLDLSRNMFSQLDGRLLPVNLVEIRLNGNQFRGLSEELLMKLDNLKSVKLDGNPWSCDLCHIVPLLDRVNRSGSNTNQIGRLRCQQPYTMAGKTLSQVHKEKLSWCTVASPSLSSITDANFLLVGGSSSEDAKVAFIAAGVAVFLLVAALLTIGIALYYSRRHMAKYYTHEERLAKDGELIANLRYDTDDNDTDGNLSPLFGGVKQLKFKFPMNGNLYQHQQRRLSSIATIDDILIKEDVNSVDDT